MSRDALSLLEAKVWLWPEWSDGSANIYAPVWDGLLVQALRADRQQFTVETRPTGVQFPRRRTLLQSHEITISKVVVTSGDRLPVAIPPDRMVLQVAWQPETWDGQTRGTWMRRIYRGVLLVSDSEGDRDGLQTNSDLRFTAETVEESNGIGQVPKGL